MIPLTRRQLLKSTAIGVAGCSASGWLDVLAARAAEPVRKKYKSCIVLWMTGGISQLDTWDLKPNAPVDNRGLYRPISTTVPGIQISEMMPKISRHAHQLAIIRSMTGSNVHPAATRDLHQGDVFKQAGVTVPALGAAVSAVHALDDFGMPTHVVIGARTRFDNLMPGPGFLGAKHSAMIVIDPASRLENLAPAVPAAEFQERLTLLEELQRGFGHQHQLNMVNSHVAGYQSAAGFMRSSKARAFDIDLEPDQLRGRYGRNQFGNGCILARRLIEIGVPFVEVKWTQQIRTGFVANELPWDTHEDQYNTFQRGMPMFDAGLSTLLEDLETRGMLDSTLVVCMAEFGRTPKIERRGGRDHFGRAFSMALAGGGIKGGQVVGKTDADGSNIVERPTSPADLLATICLALGLDPNMEFGARDGRQLEGRNASQQMTAGAPVRLLPRNANPIREVLA